MQRSIEIRPYPSDKGDFIVAVAVTEETAQRIAHALPGKTNFRFVEDYSDGKYIAFRAIHRFSSFDAIVELNQDTGIYEVAAVGSATFGTDDDFDGTKVPNGLSAQDILDAAIVIRELLAA